MDISLPVQAGIRKYQAAIEAAQHALSAYVSGAADALGLVGSYNIDTTAWTLTPIEPPEEKKDATVP